MASRTAALAGTALLSLALLGGCGSGAPGSDPTGLGTPGPDAGSGDVPMTARGLAALAFVYLSDDTASRAAAYSTYETPSGEVGVDLRYGGGEGDDGDLVRVLVTPEPEEDPRCESGDQRCVEREVDGGTLVLAWEEVAPEEDPGVVLLSLVREDEVASVLYAGPAIKGDPREIDLPIEISALEELVQDPRVGVTTDQEVVDAGEEVEDWEGGEAPDTADPTPVPVSPQALKGFFLTYSGLSGFSGTSDIPRVVEPFGPDAVGIGISISSDHVRYRDVEVVASPQAPEWLAADPCATPGYACETYDGALGPVHLLWRAGRTGEAWLVNLRADEVVAFRFDSWKVPEQEQAVAGSIDLRTLRSMLDDDVHVGMMSTAGLERVQF
ncbi:hypothetical protein [Nocardioides psychrotolerans]|uniref:hypothetical protein n=1 Tax=Nocardioides psychrotolerans TaxID=1005945 RepID=UPI0031379B32